MSQKQSERKTEESPELRFLDSFTASQKFLFQSAVKSYEIHNFPLSLQIQEYLLSKIENEETKLILKDNIATNYREIGNYI